MPTRPMTGNAGRSASHGWRRVSLALCLAGTPVRGQAGPLPELEALRQSLKITASLKESRDTSGSFVQVTCLAYHLEASLSNVTPYSFELGHEMVFIQSAINDVQYCGCFIEKGASSHPSGIELDQWPGTSLRIEDYASTDGATTLAVAPGDRGKSHPKGAGYGQLRAGEALKLKQMFHLTRGFKPEARGTIRITLPEMIVSTGEQKRRFLVQLTFDRTRALQEQQIILLDEAGIAEWLSPRHPTPQLVLAANWLACSDAAAAGKRLPALADEHPETTYTVAHLLRRLKSPSFAGQAQRVVADPSEDPGARSVCLKYLAACDWKPAVPAVLRAAAQENPEFLESAIAECLVQLSLPDAKKLLLDSMAKINLPERSPVLLSLALEKIPLEPVDLDFWNQVVAHALKIPLKFTNEQNAFCEIVKISLRHGCNDPAKAVAISKVLEAAPSSSKVRLACVNLLRRAAGEGASPLSWEQYAGDAQKLEARWLKWGRQQASGR